ncbi:MAG: tyrosine-type recombinase/integrase [Rhizomicrobium sp.]
MEWSLYDARGRRKYLAPRERGAFLRAALRVGGPVASFCAVLTLCGARISEVLALTPERIDDADATIIFRTLKQRGKVLYRAVPVPRRLLQYLNGVHHYRDAQRDPELAIRPLWPWSRTTGWRHVKHVMRQTSNPAHLATARALRHAFGAEASTKSISLTLIKKWMGHADIRTTEIYTSLVGKEERALARRIWSTLPTKGN